MLQRMTRDNLESKQQVPLPVHPGNDDVETPFSQAAPGGGDTKSHVEVLMTRIKDDTRESEKSLVSAPLKNRKKVKRKAKPYYMKLPFPWKLHKLLWDAEQEGKEDIVSWLPGGQSSV